jgi:sec-independent protein translocase protein TatB
MLDVGFSEILLTSAIALIVLGPERLPKVARQVGNWLGRARAMARQLSEQLEREVSAEELLKTQIKPPPLVRDTSPAAMHALERHAAEPHAAEPHAAEPSAADPHATDPPVAGSQAADPHAPTAATQLPHE